MLYWVLIAGLTEKVRVEHRFKDLRWEVPVTVRGEEWREVTVGMLGRVSLQGCRLWVRWGCCRAVRAKRCDLTVSHKVHGSAGLRIYCREQGRKWE